MQACPNIGLSIHLSPYSQLTHGHGSKILSRVRIRIAIPIPSPSFSVFWPLCYCYSKSHSFTSRYGTVLFNLFTFRSNTRMVCFFRNYPSQKFVDAIRFILFTLRDSFCLIMDHYKLVLPPLPSMILELLVQHQLCRFG